MTGEEMVESLGVMTAHRKPPGQMAVSHLLIILASSPDREPHISPHTMLLGLPVLRRTVLAADRAGFDQIMVQARDPARVKHLLDGTPARVLSPDETMELRSPGRLVLLSANVLAQRDWFRGLLQMPVEPGHMYRDADRVAVLDVTGSAAISAMLSRGLTASDLFGALSQAFKTVDRPLSQGQMFVLASTHDVAKAEDWLLRGLIKETEGFMSRHFERRISLAISRRLAATRVTPNTMTAVSLGIGLLGAPFFLSSGPAVQLTGALLLLAHSIVDGCDGELARLKFQESRWGGLLDFWGDNIVHIAVFSCMAAGWSLAIRSPWPLLLGALAVAGTAGSAWFVYWHTMRDKGPDGPLFMSTARSPGAGLSRLLDTLANRDFIYGVIVLSAFGKAAWFLIPAALGAPIFLLLLLWAARHTLHRGERVS